MRLQSQNRTPSGVSWQFLVAVALVIIISGCYSRTTTTSGTAVIKWVPKMVEIAMVERLSKREGQKFRDSHEKVNECVFRSQIYDLYWADQLQTDHVVLFPVEKKAFDVIKVRQVGSAQISIFQGTRNNKPFREVTVLDE
ncbi:MAG: hypothetical protein GY868_19905 [Deltaproteobacteria bacterium]|nr:hypothetical protein [Deltaproteobacteria bacterium]